MKNCNRILAMILSLVCIFALFSSISAFADYDGYWGGAAESGRPGNSDIRLAVNSGKITFPSSGQYLDSYQVRYVDAPKGHSIYVFNEPSAAKGYKDVVYHGQCVLRLAKANGFSCILFYDENNALRAGWVNSSHLTGDFPGRVAFIGGSSSYDVSNEGNFSISWSSKDFPGTRQPYAVLNETAYDCVGFTLDYQVIARNGASTRQVLGIRTVYVFDGSQWIEVGSFRYDSLGTVHVEIALDEPMDIQAVAVTADCSKPNTLSFRMAILDVLCED